MNEQNRKQIILAAVLGVILVGVLIKQFVFAPGSASSSAAKGGTPAAQAGKTAAGPKAAPAGTLQQVDIDIEALIKSVEVEPIDYAASITNSRDPMRPLVGSGIPKIDPEKRGQNGVTDLNEELAPPTDPPKPLLFLNIDAVPRSRALIWEHTLDAPGKRCPNPRVVIPRDIIPNVVDEPVAVDIRSIGLRTPPCTLQQPSYGILGLFGFYLLGRAAVQGPEAAPEPVAAAKGGQA